MRLFIWSYLPSQFDCNYRFLANFGHFYNYKYFDYVDMIADLQAQAQK